MKNIFEIDIDKKRVYGLDILRCLAILFVVVGHGNYLLPKRIADYINPFLLDGVSLFFVLSGFLIGGILLRTIEKEGTAPRILINFWIRRWFRTLPNYFLIVIILLVLCLLFKEDFSFKGVARYFFFSQNLFHHHAFWFFPEAWSLSIEEWFYLLVPVFIFVLAGSHFLNRKNAVLYTALGIVVAVTLFRFYRYTTIPVHNADEWDMLLRTQVFTRLDSLMYGVLGAYIHYYNKPHWLKYKTQLLLIGIIVLIASRFFEPVLAVHPGLYYCVFSFSVNSLATILLFPFLNELKQGKGFLFTTITCISLISYSMYLLNLSIVQGWILNNIDMTVLSGYEVIIKYLLYWTLTVLLSILLYKHYERPLTKLRDKII